MKRNSTEWKLEQQRFDELCKQLREHPYHMPLILAVDESASRLGIPVE